LAPSALDPVVTRDDQLAWLAGDAQAADDFAVVRPDDPRQRQARQARFDQLVQEPLGALVAMLLAEHIALTIPRPRQTERKFWVVSAVPSTNGGGRLATLSVGRAETMFLYYLPIGEDFYVGGRINVAASALPAEVLNGSLGLTEACVDPEPGSYESTGSDMAGLRFVVTDKLDGYAELMSWPGVIDAARLLSLRLMRKGVSLQGRWHNFPLADVLLGDKPWPAPNDPDPD
jgi:hypothetical protein